MVRVRWCVCDGACVVWCGTNSSRDVWRWHYSPGQRSNLGTGVKVIYGIPCCGHLTRTLEMDDEGNLYVR